METVTRYVAEGVSLRDRHGTVIGDGVSVPEPETPRRKVSSLLCQKHAARLADLRQEALSRPASAENDERSRQARRALAHEIWVECEACRELFAQAPEMQPLSTESAGENVSM